MDGSLTSSFGLATAIASERLRTTGSVFVTGGLGVAVTETESTGTGWSEVNLADAVSFSCEEPGS